MTDTTTLGHPPQDAMVTTSLVPRPPRPMAKRWSGQMLEDSWAGYESYSGMSEYMYQSDIF